MNRSIPPALAAGFLLLFSCSCQKDSTPTPSTSTDAVVVPVGKTSFLSGGLSEPITVVARTLFGWHYRRLL